MSTTIGRWALPFILLGLAWHQLGPALRPFRRESFELAPLGRMFHLGLPIGIQTALEFTAFGAVGLLMGRLGTIPVAAHQVAINLASLTFMVPLGMGQAAAVLVGHAIGALTRRRTPAARPPWCGVHGITSIVFLVIPTCLPALHHRRRDDDPRVGCCPWLEYSIFDGAQAVRRHPPGAGTPACPC
jgi:Na+-driven multidrug efflux pump